MIDGNEIERRVSILSAKAKSRGMTLEQLTTELLEKLQQDPVINDLNRLIYELEFGTEIHLSIVRSEFTIEIYGGKEIQIDAEPGKTKVYRFPRKSFDVDFAKSLREEYIESVIFRD